MITHMARQTLIDIVRSNRDKHRAVFEEAFANYREEVIKEMEQALEDARAGRRIWRSTKLVQPVNQTSYYDSALRKLELTTDQIIELGDSDFNQLVLDQWGWGHSFAASNSAYVKSEVGKQYMKSMFTDE